MLPPEVEKVLQQVQAHANYMPDWQMEVRLERFGILLAKTERTLESDEHRTRLRLVVSILKF